MEHGASEAHTESAARPRHWMRWAMLLVVVGAVVCTAYVRTHPLVFNESFLGHAHCISCTIKGLEMYALDHGGRFPSHSNGYGDALVLILPEVNVGALLTGPGYDGKIFEAAALTNGHVPEVACGRVYVQGLCETNDSQIVLLFDKLPTPGGDHCNVFHRLTAPLGREVALIDGSTHFIPETRWPAFASNQIQLLLEAGIPQKEAERLYASKPK